MDVLKRKWTKDRQPGPCVAKLKYVNEIILLSIYYIFGKRLYDYFRKWTYEILYDRDSENNIICMKQGIEYNINDLLITVLESIPLPPAYPPQFVQKRQQERRVSEVSSGWKQNVTPTPKK